MTINIASFVGTPWSYGTADCFALCRRFYSENWGIEVPNIAHPLLWEVTNPELDLVRSNLVACGFEVTDITPRTARYGDALLMQIGAGVRVLNHCAVFIGAGQFLHQPFREDSRIDLWSGQWRDATLITARHPGVPRVDVRPVLDVISLLPEVVRKRFDGS